MTPDYNLKVLYKYLSFSGAKKTLEGKAIQLSSPLTFNDPFDTNLEATLGEEAKEFTQNLQPAFFEFVSGNIDYQKLREGRYKNVIILMNQALKKSPDIIEKVKEDVFSRPVDALYDFEELKKHSKEITTKLKKDFSSWGIFCSSKRKDSLLMWAHYADQHKGVVFEFQPTTTKDSTFFASKPVTYSQERPVLYKTPSDLIRHSLMMSLHESVEEVLSNIIYTKSHHWEYEAELRLAIPDWIPQGTMYKTLPFHKEELASIYLGCRMQQEQKNELISLAVALNPKVEIFQTILSEREYKLEWQSIK